MEGGKNQTNKEKPKTNKKEKKEKALKKNKGVIRFCTALQGLWDGKSGSPWATKLLDTPVPQPALQVSAHTELAGLNMEPPAPFSY